MSKKWSGSVGMCREVGRMAPNVVLDHSPHIPTDPDHFLDIFPKNTHFFSLEILIGALFWGFSPLKRPK